VATDETTSRAIDTSPAAQRPPTAAERRANEHAGTTDTEVLARDIAQTREELSVTIDAIVDRVSPKKVVERGKQQAREGVQDATEIVKGHATTAAGVVREKALVASEVVKDKVAELKDRKSGTSDSTDVRSPLAPATSANVASSSPLPAGTVTVDMGEPPPPEAAPTTGALADAADAGRPGVEPPGADLPSHRPVGSTGSAPVPPVYAGAGAAALVAAVLLLLRRRSNRRRRNRVRVRR
jgi:hypothetical protein